MKPASLLDRLNLDYGAALREAASSRISSALGLVLQKEVDRLQGNPRQSRSSQRQVAKCRSEFRRKQEMRLLRLPTTGASAMHALCHTKKNPQWQLLFGLRFSCGHSPPRRSSLEYLCLRT